MRRLSLSAVLLSDNRMAREGLSFFAIQVAASNRDPEFVRLSALYKAALFA
jgi:hypothetical protein